MPNPKLGTITNDLEAGVKSCKQGQVSFKTDRNGGISVPVGKVSFENQALVENISKLIEDIDRAKPSGAQGDFFVKATVSSTMGKGFRLDTKKPPFAKLKKSKFQNI